MELSRAVACWRWQSTGCSCSAASSACQWQHLGQVNYSVWVDTPVLCISLSQYYVWLLLYNSCNLTQIATALSALLCLGCAWAIVALIVNSGLRQAQRRVTDNNAYDIIQIPMNLHDFSLLLVGILTLIILYSYIGNFLQHRKLHLLHETGVGILIGVGFGFFMHYVVGVQKLEFDEEIFFYGLLPPMIFAGGYNLKKKDFGKNFIYIITYGLLGTLLVFGIVFGLTYAVSELRWIIPLRAEEGIQKLDTALIVKYSATISATDSVAALTLIKSSEFPQLFSIIFGQGMVNDAVAIILFKVVGGLFDEIHSDMTAGQIFKTILSSFLGTVVVSVLIGLLTALLCSYLFKHCRFLVESEVTQVAFTYIFGILSYVLAEFCDMSGVITVLISGVTLAHYNYYNLTVGGMHATTVTFQTISFLAEAIVFVYLGVSTVYYFLTEVISFSFLFLQLAICVISRLIAIFGLSFVFKKIFKKKWKIANKDLAVVSFAGMIRGSVAFALILTIQPNETNENEVSVIKSTTLALVCMTTVVLGALMPHIIRLLLGDAHAHSQPIKQQSEQPENREQLLVQESEQVQVHQKAQKKKKKAGFFKYSDQHFWRPMFIYKYEQQKERFKLYKRIMKYNNRESYLGGIFYLLDLVQVDYRTLENFVSKIESDEGKLDQNVFESIRKTVADEGLVGPKRSK